MNQGEKLVQPTHGKITGQHIVAMSSTDFWLVVSIQPLWKILSSKWDSSPNRTKNVKPPPRLVLHHSLPFENEASKWRIKSTQHRREVMLASTFVYNWVLLPTRKCFYKKILTENAAHNSEKNIEHFWDLLSHKTPQKPLIQPNNTHKKTPRFVLSQRSCHLLNDILRRPHIG